MTQCTIQTGNDLIKSTVVGEKTVLQVLKQAGIDIPAPCGGKGRCGKCIIKNESGGLSEPGADEQRVLGATRIRDGYRLACIAKVIGDCHILVPEIIDEANIMMDIASEHEKNSRGGVDLVTRSIVSMKPPTLEDQRSDLERLIQVAGIPWFANDPDALMQLPDQLRDSRYQPEVICVESRPVEVLTGRDHVSVCGLAVDIGTTTVAVYLYDYNVQAVIDRISFLNPQKSFGADVITRIEACIESQDNVQALHASMTGALNQAINTLCQRNAMTEHDIYVACIVGNTTMTHLFMNITPKYIASAPFTPCTTLLHRLKPAECSTKIHKNGIVYVLPSISGYVGADTIGAVLSTSIDQKEQVHLLCDIGTNGEIVLSDKDRMFACATAAGPAFEGANIRCGVGGITGAIDSISIDGDVTYTVINGNRKKPLGICGSGIVDVIAQMIRCGIVDETGRIVEYEECPKSLSDSIKKRIITHSDSGDAAFVIEVAANTDTNEDIIITQKDVRELQNAKAAIAAGIVVLIEKAGYTVEDIDRCLLAGGFGNYLHLQSALDIGLIPKALADKTYSAGNAAGAGAIAFLSNAQDVERVMQIQKNTQYIELSSDPHFTNAYVDAMFFS